MILWHDVPQPRTFAVTDLRTGATVTAFGPERTSPTFWRMVARFFHSFGR